MRGGDKKLLYILLKIRILNLYLCFPFSFTLVMFPIYIIEEPKFVSAPLIHLKLI